MNEHVISPLLATFLERLQSRESLDLEFKAAKGGLPNDLWSTVSAFANTSGGWLILGVGEGEEGTTIDGVPNALAQLQRFHDQVRNREKISYPVCGAGDASIESLSGKELIVIRVPAAPRRVRPVYINHNPYAGTYVRRHAGDFHCTKPEVDRMMREASDVAADSAILVHFGWDDIDRASFDRYRRRFQAHEHRSPWIGYDDDRFLAAVGGYRSDRERGMEGLTVAGLLMFGTDTAIREWRTRHLIDYRLIGDESQFDVRWDDRVVWEGNLLGAYETIYPRLSADARVPFRLERGTRIDDSPVHVALREALVNLLVHADYAETQVSLIKHTPEGYLFRNPGSSRVSERALLLGDESDPRNPELVRMFRFIGLADEAGTGMPKIMTAWRNLGLQLPAIDGGTERYEFSLFLRHAHLLSDDDRRWLSELGMEWTQEEQLALVLARHEGDVDNLRLRSLTGQHPADATKTLGGLRDRGYLQMIGVKRSARYEISEAALPAQPVPAHQPALPGLEGTPEDLQPTAGKLQGNNPSLQGTEPSLEGIWPELLTIARPAREQQRLTAAVRDTTIIRLCSRAPLSVRQLAELMDRSPAFIRETVRALVQTGAITFLYPEDKNHPRQKYVTVRAGAGVA